VPCQPALVAILAALRRRDRDGIGAALDIAMYDSMFQLGQIGLASALARAAGASGEPRMEVWGGNPRYALYPTQDGKTVAVSLLEGRYWKKFCDVIGRPDLASGPEDPSARLSSHGALNAQFRDAIAGYCSANNRDVIARAMAERDIPVVPVLTPDEAVASPHAQVRGLVRQVPHPNEGTMTELRNPLHRSGLVRDVRQPAPGMGADNVEVLTSFGLTENDVRMLAASGTI